ncbi:MAG: class I SAM-dependent methyltransferase [Bacillota bacterium]|nr:class I SAM-dependent methyltransferase [Bacillota bacterium]
MKLSKRLATAAKFCSQADTIADVGADRGELSYFLLENGLAQKAILSDISQNSLNRAVMLFQNTPLWEKAQFRVGDGLSILNPGEADTIVMAGMGGQTICNILAQGKNVVSACRGLVIQAMGNSSQVRRWLQKSGFVITKEAMVKEGRHYYTIIRSQPGYMELTAAEIYAGPILLANKEPLLRELLEREIEERESTHSFLASKNQGRERQESLKGELKFLYSLRDML